MKERGILFSAPMVRAILAGTKTQTRGVATPKRSIEPMTDECPHGMPGDRLWVREAWRGYETDDALPPREIRPYTPVYFEATKSFFLGYQFKTGKLRPGMFMPRWASRITLEVTGVRVERLQDISAADALAEGVQVHPDHHGKPRDSIYSPVSAYRDLWESINGPGSWAANPWVWVVEFKRIEAA